MPLLNELAVLTLKREVYEKCSITDTAGKRMWRFRALLYIRNSAYTCAYMRGETRQRWQKLCEEAAEEQDHNKLMKLIDEINTLLETKEQRLSAQEQQAKKQSAV